MRIEFAHPLAASPGKVYAALLDPSVIQRSIDGCDSLTRIAENTYATTLRVGGAGIKGTVKLTATRPGEALTLAIEGKGLPGSVQAKIHMRLVARGEGTEVQGESEVLVGGFAAALGSKILESGARGAIADFFLRFAAQLTSGGP